MNFERRLVKLESFDIISFLLQYNNEQIHDIFKRRNPPNRKSSTPRL